eukprot:gene5373-6704_t
MKLHNVHMLPLTTASQRQNHNTQRITFSQQQQPQSNNHKNNSNGEIDYEKYNKPLVDPKSIGNGIIECCEKLFHLPTLVGQIYESKGINQFYDWQKECLSTEELLSGKNLVYSLPTSGGKTLVAEIILLRSVVLKKKKGLFIFPFTEKAKSLKDLGQRLSFNVEPYYGCNGTIPVPKGNCLLVCTIEKANVIINQMIEENRIDEIGCCVIDELHMIGDGERGLTLELLISKLLYVSKGSVQIIGMSATIPNVTSLKNWLRGSVYQGDFRPVPLTEYLVNGNKIFDNNNTLKRTLTCKENDDYQKIMDLCLEVIPDHSVLIFCSSKDLSFKTAQELAMRFPPRILAEKKDDRDLLISSIEASNGSGSRIDEAWGRMIKSGVFFHNSSLTNDERSIIEGGFRDHTLLVLCATSTLSAGVNLPARRVILRNPMMGPHYLTPKAYKQMCGRAGRAGIDEFGESFLIVNSTQLQIKKGKELLVSPLDPLFSEIKSGNSFQKIVLDCISSGMADNVLNIIEFLSFTFYATQVKPERPDHTPFQHVQQQVLEAIKFLETSQYIKKMDKDMKLKKLQQQFKQQKKPFTPDIVVDDDVERWVSTGLGSACFKSTLSLKETAKVYQELKSIQEKGIVISEELHMCYITTPMFNIPNCNWEKLSVFLGGLNKTKAEVAKIIGISDDHIQCKLNGTGVVNAEVDAKHARFYVSLALCDLIHESPLYMTSTKYEISRGDLQGLMANAGSFAWMVSSFCKKLGWNELDALVSMYIQRLDKGVRQEIIHLVEIPSVKQGRARQLWNAGYKTVKSISLANPEDMVRDVKFIGKNPLKQAQKLIRDATKLLEQKSLELIQKSEELLNKNIP